MDLFKYYGRKVVSGFIVGPLVFLLFGCIMVWFSKNVVGEDVSGQFNLILVIVLVIIVIDLLAGIWSIFVRDNVMRWRLNCNYQKIGQSYNIKIIALRAMVVTLVLCTMFVAVATWFSLGREYLGDIFGVAMGLAMFSLFVGMLIYTVTYVRLQRLNEIFNKLNLVIPTPERYKMILNQAGVELKLRLVDPIEFREAGRVILFPQHIDVVVTNDDNEVLFVIGRPDARNKGVRRYLIMDAQGNKIGEIGSGGYWWRMYEILIPGEKKLYVDFGKMLYQFKVDDFGEIIANMKCSAAVIQKVGGGDFDCEIFDNSGVMSMIKSGTLKTVSTYGIRMSVNYSEKQLLVLSLAACMIFEKVQTTAIGILRGNKLI